MKTLFVFLFLIALVGCSGAGTNTGNPTNDAAPDFNSTPVTGNESNILSNALCNKIKACYPSSSDTNCKSQIVSLANFTDEVGLNPPYSTLQDLEVDVQSNTFEFNVASLNSCLNSISAISCSSSVVLSAYSQSSPGDFSSTYKLFRASSMCLSLEH